MSMAKVHSHALKGFTILEVLVVLVFISVFAVIAVLRQPAPSVTLRANAQVLKAHIRYAQLRAMNTNRNWEVNYNLDSGGYWLTMEGDAQKRPFPGEAQDIVQIGAKGITISPSPFILRFDTWGRPQDVNGNGALNLTLSWNNGTQTQAMTITPNTGFIP